ncbi:MAG: lysozyme [Dehalococcoidales bacterium]|nr:lysozyme [Dehalococcoidales bacterium]
MRHIIQAGLDLIKGFEGLFLTAYFCAAGYLTIGWGHLVKKDEPKSITKERAEVYLSQDVQAAERAVLRLIKVPLSDAQFSALVSFVYNLGAGALQRSTLRSKLNRGEYVDASGEFRKWVWAGGKKLNGLIRRREAERRMFLS